MGKRLPLPEAKASRPQIANARIAVARVLVRADAVYDMMVAPLASLDFDSETIPAAGLFELANTPGGIVLHGVMLYLALVWQVAATWNGMNTGIRLSEVGVDAALRRLPMDLLREFRNSVMHTGQVGDSREEDLMPEAEAILVTAREAIDVMRNYLRSDLAQTAKRLRERSPSVG